MYKRQDCYYGLQIKKNKFEIAWGVGLDNKSDTREYEISYTVNDAIGKYNDYAELYWQFVGAVSYTHLMYQIIFQSMLSQWIS